MIVVNIVQILVSKSWLLVLPILAVAIITAVAGNASGIDVRKSVDKIIFPVTACVVLIGLIWAFLQPIEGIRISIIYLIITAVLFGISFIPLGFDRSLGQVFGYFLCGFTLVYGISRFAGFADKLPFWVALIIGIVSAVLCITFLTPVINIVVTVIGGAGMSLACFDAIFQHFFNPILDGSAEVLLRGSYESIEKIIYVVLVGIGFVIQIITYKIKGR